MSASEIRTITNSLAYFMCEQFLKDGNEKVIEWLNNHYKEIYPKLEPIESALISDYKKKDTIDMNRILGLLIDFTVFHFATQFEKQGIIKRKNFCQLPCALQYFLKYMDPIQQEQFCEEFYNNLVITKNVIVEFIKDIYKRIPRIFKMNEIHLYEFSDTTEIITTITRKLNKRNSQEFNKAFKYIINN
jgi:hypothetical protein